jgi:penicillin-binding protein 2
MPSEEWKIRTFHQKWYAGEVISVGIGQGAVAATPIQLMRALAGITMDGHLVRPHLVNFDNLPSSVVPHFKEVAAKTPEEVTVPIDQQNWEIITDAMAQVVEPVGTAPSAHVQGVDFAGKTGSAQTVSNAARKILKGKQYNDNSWFVGVVPRRNPDIVVCVLFEGGEHGKLAARLAAQVVRAFVDKQRKVLNNYAYAAPPGYGPPVRKAVEKPASQKESTDVPAAQPTAGQSPAAKLNNTNDVEMAAVWNEQDQNGKDDLGTGRFRVAQDAKPQKRAVAAPGITP